MASVSLPILPRPRRFRVITDLLIFFGIAQAWALRERCLLRRRWLLLGRVVSGRRTG